MPESRTGSSEDTHARPVRTARRSLHAARGSDARAAEFEQRGDCGCWAIADGAGRPGRAPAARIAVNAVLQCARQSFELASDAVRGCMLDARVAARHGPRSMGLDAMGARLALLVSDSRTASWGSVGDSRIYHFRAGRLADQTNGARPPEPQMRHSELRPHDTFLLCTSGWWKHLTEPEMELDLAKAADPDEWLAIMADRILRRDPTSDVDPTAIGIFM